MPTYIQIPNEGTFLDTPEGRFLLPDDYKDGENFVDRSDKDDARWTERTADGTVVPHTYFQIRVKETHWTPNMLPDDAPHPRPTGLTARYVTSPHWNRTYICSASPSLHLTFLDYEYEWPEGTFAVNALTEDEVDTLMGWYVEHTYEIQPDDDPYVDWYAWTGAGFSTPEDQIPWSHASIESFHNDGEFETDEDAREYAYGNHNV